MKKPMKIAAGLVLVLAGAGALILSTSGCKGSKSPGGAGDKTKTGGTSGAATEPMPKGHAWLTGVVNIEGKPEKGEPYKCVMEGDVPNEDVIATGDKLANVFVYVKEGKQWKFETPGSPAKIDQKGCRYVPHVLGVMAGQKVEITNSDGPPVKNHNVKYKGASLPFNEDQAVNTTIAKRFSKEEMFAKLECNVHNHMSCYIGVLYHPLFAVSGADGSFKIPHPLPPGKYTLVAKHEQLGEKTAAITVEKDKQPAAVTFKFKAD